ncbi:hypothetical protein VT06_16580 [Arsukibacterium sp. MJ3]|uniref:hypothetical protein n=1 Tax=Arsukibacterium sp. MJ3 TaxID=1632859 RepID=UPI00062708CA|nr:hypothetical protein [Arsukibacterium sp. MJ3]KKO47529.1 hypothetical protein VT06_16580 [Arsukibacterium sp. MJ3]
MNILQRIKSAPNLLLLIIGAGFIAPFFALVSLISSTSGYEGGLVVFYLLSSVFAMISSVMLLLKASFSRLCFLTAFLLSCLPTLFAEYRYGLEGAVAMACMMLIILFVLIFYLFKNKQVIRYMAT